MSTLPYPGAAPPPPGVVAKINAPAGPIAKISYTVTTLEIFFPTIALIVRLYVRLFLMKKWTRVDSCFILAYILLVVNVAIGYTFPKYGQGKDIWNVTPADFSKFLMYENLQQSIYEFAVLFSKTTLLLQLEEIFAPKISSYSGRRKLIWTMIVLNAVFFLVEAFLRILQCLPREKIWNPSVPGHCLDVEKAFISTSAVNVLEDIIILALPVVWVSYMKVSFKKKLSIAAVFGVGVFVCVCSVMRLVGSIQSVSKTDLTVALVPVALWAQAEEAAALTVTFLPLLPRLAKEFRRATGSTTPHSSWQLKTRSSSNTPRYQTKTKGSPVTSEGFHRRDFASIDSVDTLHERAKNVVSANSRELASAQGIVRTVDIHQSIADK